MKRSYWFGVAAGLAAMFPLPSQAVTVALGPPDFGGSNFYTYAYGDGLSTSPTGPGVTSYSANSIDPVNHPASAAATLDIKTNPFPSITAHSSASNGSAGITGAMTYQFRIIGSDPYDPANPIYVPTIVSYKGSASASSVIQNQTGATTSFNIAGDNFAESYRVTVGASPLSQHQINGFNQPFTDTSFDEHKTYSMIENAFYHIDIQASAVAYGTGSASAFIDPYIQIDPTFADAGKYHIVLSQGVGNFAPAIATTPLPASLPLFGAALLGLAGLGYGTKRRSAAPDGCVA